MRRDQSEDYLDSKEVRVYRDAPGGGLNITRAVDESACARMNERGIAGPGEGGRWRAPIIGHIPPSGARGVNLMMVGRELPQDVLRRVVNRCIAEGSPVYVNKAPVNLNNVDEWQSNARRTTPDVLR